MNILLVDDDQDGRRHVAAFLRDLGYLVEECNDGEEALALFGSSSFPMVLSDIKMPKMSGLELLRRIEDSAKNSETSVVLFTGHGDMDSAITALRSGAYDYLLKPINVEELAIITKRIEKHHLLRHENKRLNEHFEEELEAATHETKVKLTKLRSIAAKSVGLESIGFFSEAMRNIARQAKKYHTDRAIPVLIQGETGTGKEVIARLIHFSEMEETTPFIDINCAAITPSLFESEMFGYDEGSFTGSVKGGRPGKIEIAHGGTLFLDEIADMPLELQGKLLRVIEEKELYRVGGSRKIKTDVRIICASNTDIAARVRDGKFRQDLYYRLNVGHIFIPPLRERKEEIIPMANHFLVNFSKLRKKQFNQINSGAAQILLTHPWLGNIRELKNTFEWLTFMYDDVEVREEHLKILKNYETENQPIDQANTIDVEKFLLPKEHINIERYMNKIIQVALELFKGNKTKTAQYLGISRSSLACRIKKISEQE